MPKVQLLVLITPHGPVPYSYADCERGKASQHVCAARYRRAGLTTGQLYLQLSEARATSWMCHAVYRHPQMVLGHALARIEGRTESSFGEWYSHVA